MLHYSCYSVKKSLQTSTSEPCNKLTYNHMRPFASNVKSCVIPPWTFTQTYFPSFSDGRLICPLPSLPFPRLTFIFQEELIQYQHNFIQLLNNLFRVG